MTIGHLPLGRVEILFDSASCLSSANVYFIISAATGMIKLVDYLCQIVG